MKQKEQKTNRIKTEGQRVRDRKSQRQSKTRMESVIDRETNEIRLSRL